MQVLIQHDVRGVFACVPVVVQREDGEPRGFQCFLVGRVEVIAVQDNPLRSGAFGRPGRLTRILGRTRAGCNFDGPHPFLFQAIVEGGKAIGHEEDRFVSSVLPGLGQGQAAHDVAGADAGVAVGPDQ